MPICKETGLKYIELVEEIGIEEAARIQGVKKDSMRRMYKYALDELTKPDKPKILLFDIETASPTAYTWGIWKQVLQPKQVISDWFMLCWSAKWLFEDKMITGVVTPLESLMQDDERITMAIWNLLDEADIIIGHNVDKFDRKKVNSRFAKYGLIPPSPYQTIDTLKIMRKNFSILSNKLDESCKYFGLNVKIDTGGLELWKLCVGDNGQHGEIWGKYKDDITRTIRYDKKNIQDALDKMDEYCQNDVWILEELYLKLRPWMKSHPNLGLYHTDQVCPVCQSKRLIPMVKKYYTQMSRFPTYRCAECGAIMKGRRSEINMKSNPDLVRSVAR